MGTKTINLRNMPEELVTRAKLYAMLRGITLKDFIVEAMQTALEQSSKELASVTMFVRTGTRRQNKTPTQKRGHRKEDEK